MEFALIAPILIYLVLSIPVFGLIVRSWMVISGAARDGGRAASLLNVVDRVATAKLVAGQQVYLPHKHDDGRDLFVVAQDVKAVVTGDQITVSVTYRQPTFVPFMASLLGGGAMPDTFEMTAKATFQLETGQ